MPTKRGRHRRHNVTKATFLRGVGQRAGTELMQIGLFHMGCSRAGTFGDAGVQTTRTHLGTGIGKNVGHTFSLRPQGGNIGIAIVLGQSHAERHGGQRPTTIDQPFEYNKIKK